MTAPTMLHYTVGQLTATQKERIRQFVAALRSGRYTQGRKLLATIAGSGDEVTARYCCLGVACFEAMRMGCNLTVTPLAASLGVKLSFADATQHIDGSVTSLPVIVRKFFGFNLAVGSPDLSLPPALLEKFEEKVRDRIVQAFGAIQLNDEFHMSFDEIADCFEYTYLREDWDATHAGN